MRMYKLVDKIPVETDSFEESNNSKNIDLLDTFDDVQVSTVFLGWDHSFGSETPILFETMVFGGIHSDYQRRYTTYEDAEAGHKETIKMISDDPEVKRYNRNKNLKNLGL